MLGLYDILYKNQMDYQTLLNTLYYLLKIVPINYTQIEKQLDEIYDDTEYEQWVENHITINR